MERILLATDGRDAADGAARVAAALESDGFGTVEVVRVVEPGAIYGESWTERIAYSALELEKTGVESVRDAVRGRLHELVPNAEWPITVAVGPVPQTIVQVGEQLGATQIVLGLGRHQRSDRWFGTETALRVTRIASVPVLAVPEYAQGRPGSAVLATDFSDFSKAAILSAAALCADGAALHLAHVLWAPTDELPPNGDDDWEDRQRRAATAQIEEVGLILERDSGHPVTVHLLIGDPAAEILALSDRVGADLVASGSHGSGFLTRLIAGSVSTRLLRGSDRSVLITPPGVVSPAERAKDRSGSSKALVLLGP